MSLAEAAAAAGVEHFVFASSTLVYDGSSGPADERTAPAPWSGYGRAKLEAEHALSRIAEAGTMRVGVLRLPHVWGGQVPICSERPLNFLDCTNCTNDRCPEERVSTGTCRRVWEYDSAGTMR